MEEVEDGSGEEGKMEGGEGRRKRWILEGEEEEVEDGRGRKGRWRGEKEEVEEVVRMEEKEVEGGGEGLGGGCGG